MIALRVVDVTPRGPYQQAMSDRSILHLSDDVQVRRTDTGLVLEDAKGRHYFNKDGEYTGTMPK